MTAAPLPDFDTHRLLADLRADKPEAETRVMAMTFGGQIGRTALALILSLGGVGARRGVGLSAVERAHLDGRLDLAVEILELAGFDAPSAVLAVMTDKPLEGRNDERSGHHDDGHDDPNVDRYPNLDD